MRGTFTKRHAYVHKYPQRYNAGTMLQFFEIQHQKNYYMPRPFQLRDLPGKNLGGRRIHSTTRAPLGLIIDTWRRKQIKRSQWCCSWSRAYDWAWTSARRYSKSRDMREGSRRTLISFPPPTEGSLHGTQR
jgi:hypothetical protein